MLNNFEINKYKCFKNFKIDNLSQINIISGKNNVGKTAFLELISIIKNTKNLRLFQLNIASIFELRDLDEEDINGYFETINLSIKKSNDVISIKYKTIDELNDEEFSEIERYGDTHIDFLLMYENDKLLTVIPFIRGNTSFFSRIYREKMQISFINASKPNNSDLTSLYSKIQDLGLQDKFLEYLQLIDKNIIHIEPQIRENKKSFLRIGLANPKQSLISSELGEGTNRFIEILCILLTNSNGTVLIDEIENGIHYTRLYDIYKAMIEIVQLEKIQLFMTTHDGDSIEALLKASEDMNYNEVSAITLVRDNENIIYPMIRKYSSFTMTVNSGMDIR